MLEEILYKVYINSKHPKLCEKLYTSLLQRNWNGVCEYSKELSKSSDKEIEKDISVTLNALSVLMITNGGVEIKDAIMASTDQVIGTMIVSLIEDKKWNNLLILLAAITIDARKEELLLIAAGIVLANFMLKYEKSTAYRNN